MAIEKILGEEDAVETGASTVRSDDGDSSVIYVEGPLSVLEGLSELSAFVPDGMELVGSRIDPTDSGFGRMSITLATFVELSELSSVALPDVVPETE